ncbi:transcriptional regulator, AraC family [Actinobacteria bacterium OK074]|nr:transcriptional regulator, AraC family [Actinobacteria bacterium OK074]
MTAPQTLTDPRRYGVVRELPYGERPLPSCYAGGVREVLDWMELHADQELTVDKLAAHARMAPRTFSRHFRRETGTTPYRWLLERRTLIARRMLETTDASVESIAARTGFVNGAALRHQFTRSLETSPRAYRRTFRDPAPR